MRLMESESWPRNSVLLENVEEVQLKAGDLLLQEEDFNPWSAAMNNYKNRARMKHSKLSSRNSGRYFSKNPSGDLENLLVYETIYSFDWSPQTPIFLVIINSRSNSEIWTRYKPIYIYYKIDFSSAEVFLVVQHYENIMPCKLISKLLKRIGKSSFDYLY